MWYFRRLIDQKVLRKKIVVKHVVLLTSLLLSSVVASQAQNTLEGGFQNPPQECRPDVFYQVMGGMQTKEGLVKDFEAMQRQGIGGILLMQMPDQLVGIVQWPFRDYPGKISICSDEWFAQWNYAIGQLDRLGLTFSTVPSPGWSHVGGPWVPADKSVKVLVGKSTQIRGPVHFKNIIARAPVSYERKPTLPSWSSDAQAWKMLRESWGDYYRDAAVVAYPANIDANKPIPSDKIIDLTRQMDADGRLTWDVPEGEWIVERLGCAAFNGPNHPASIEGSGLEVDRMDPNTPKLVLDNYVGRLAREARAKGYKCFKGFDTDSYEAGRQNFHEDFIAQFKKRMGYDCVPWLPAWLNMKMVIGNAEMTNRFRYDMQRVTSDLWIDGFYKGVREWADKNHVTWMIEPYFSLTIDWRTVASKADIAGSEFWVNDNLAIADSILKDLFGPAPDTSELYGKNIVWAEAFTANSYGSAWRNDPWLLKPYGDNAFCHGVNHFVMHGFVHNPWGDNIQPGMSFGLWGTQFSRNVTWWPYSSAWHRYLARCQFLLRQGLPVSDVLAYPPKVEHIPSPVLECTPYKQVVCNDETLLTRISIKNGRIVLPNGGSYAALAIPPQKIFIQRTLTPEALKRLRELVKDGMTLIGEPVPAKSVSMQNYPECDKQMAALITEIWGDAKASVPGERNLGKGRVIWGRPVAEVLNEVAGGADFVGSVPVVVKDNKANYDFFHRSTPEAEIYFVANLSSESLAMTGSFRITGRKPQLWDAVTGQTRILPEYSEKDGHTVIPMSFAPRQSCFVIFPKKSEGNHDESKVNLAAVKPLLTLEGSWQVAFDPQWGGPVKIEFAALEDWTQRSEKGIKYYSGTATYSKRFDVPESVAQTKASVYLDLGKVKNIARVHLNGKEIGIVWCAPWRVDISGVLKTKDNTLEIDVANTWVNRIIGDEQEPLDVEMTGKIDDPRKGGYKADVYGDGLKDLPDWLVKGEPRPSKGRYTFVNWQFYNKDAPLLESGLMGPVRIMAHE
jgi:hypothetical protein